MTIAQGATIEAADILAISAVANSASAAAAAAVRQGGAATLTTISATGGSLDNVTLGATTGVVVDRMTLGSAENTIPGRISSYDTGSGVPLISLFASNSYSNGIVPGIQMQQYAGGTLSVSTSGSYNGFIVSGDNVDFKGGTGSAFGIDLLFGGNNTTGSRVAVYVSFRNGKSSWRISCRNS